MQPETSGQVFLHAGQTLQVRKLDDSVSPVLVKGNTNVILQLLTFAND